MDFKEVLASIKQWRLTRYKVINFSIGLFGLLVYEFVGRPIYRPYIYSNNINDYHVADTLGNTFGTLPTIFFLVALLSNGPAKGNFLIKLGTISVIAFELAHPLLGKPIDLRDILATALTGCFSYLLHNTMFKRTKEGSRSQDTL